MSVRYFAYADDVTSFVKNEAGIDEVGKEISGYETVTGAKINCNKSVGLRLDAWKGFSLSVPFTWTDGPVKIFGVWLCQLVGSLGKI